MQMMEQERIFDLVRVFALSGREDDRGTMQVIFCQENILSEFSIHEQRVYQMPKAGTFFGIHYQELTNPQAKLITVIQGAGVDYVVDLRPESPTFRQWKAVELDEETKKAVYIPAGFGHAFLSTRDNTIQLFAVDHPFVKAAARRIHYFDPTIGLQLPTDKLILSEDDRTAPFLSIDK